MNRKRMKRCRNCHKWFHCFSSSRAHNNSCCSSDCLGVAGELRVTNTKQIGVVKLGPLPETRAYKWNKRKKKLKVRALKRQTPDRVVKRGFYDSEEWLQLRYRVFERDGRVCACCRTTSGQLHVDHIQPRSLRPDLQLDIANMQVLCKDCNLGKLNHFSTDWKKRVDDPKS